LTAGSGPGMKFADFDATGAGRDTKVRMSHQKDDNGGLILR
jgi:hypothetical protein